MKENEDKNILDDEHTEELPVNENVVWHEQEEEDSLDRPVKHETRLIPITADEPIEEELQSKKVKKVIKKKVVHKKGNITKSTNKKDEKIKPANKETKKNNRKSLVAGSVFLAILVLCAVGYYFFTQYQKNQVAKQEAYDKVYNQLKITFKETQEDEDGKLIDPTLFEYGSVASDPMELIDTYYGEISCEPKTIDTSKVGSVSLTYTASAEDSYKEIVTKEFKLEVTIHDTQSPTVEFNESSITMTEGDELDVKTNVKAVSDPVDGDLEYVEEEPKKEGSSAPFYEAGWYTITTDLDTETVGNYTVKVKACDVNANSTELAYVVTVKQKEPTQFMAIGTYNLKKITSLNQMSDPVESSISETGEWTDVENYLGNVQYRDETQYSSQDEMISDAQSYLKENFDSLAVSSGTTEVLGISLEYTEATAYYMAALDDDGNVMYYFYAIV